MNEMSEVKGLFQKNIIITGKHSEYMKALVAKPDLNLKQGIFNRQVDVLVMASVVGKIFSRKAELEPLKDSEGNENKVTMFLDQINSVRPELELNYRMIMLLEDRETLDIEERINRAFRYDRDLEKQKECEKIFMHYVLGGLEVLYEKLIEPSKTLDDYVDNIYLFVKDFQDRYYRDEINQEIYSLCQLATT